MTKKQVFWETLAQQLWEEQVKEQIVELEDDTPKYRNILNQPSIRRKIEKAIERRTEAWEALAHQLWEEQVKEQLAELEEVIPHHPKEGFTNIIQSFDKKPKDKEAPEETHSPT